MMKTKGWIWMFMHPYSEKIIGVPWLKPFCGYLLIWAPFSLQKKDFLVRKECFLRNWHRNSILSSYSAHLNTWSQIALKQNHFHKPESAALLSLARLLSINTAVWSDQIICHETPLFKGLPCLLFLHYLTIHVLSILNHQAWTSSAIFHVLIKDAEHTSTYSTCLLWILYLSVFTRVCSRLGVFV